MEIRLHLPRRSEASIVPEIREDLTIRPRFHRRNGWLPVLHFTTIDAKGKEEYHVLMISAATKYFRIEKLNEVIPLCDDEAALQHKKKEPKPETPSDVK